MLSTDLLKLRLIQTLIHLPKKPKLFI